MKKEDADSDSFIAELTEKLHYKVISHMQADERITELEATIKDLREACWCVIGSIQDEDDRAYLKAALKEKTK